MEETKRYTLYPNTSSKKEAKESTEKKSESQRIAEMPVTSDSLEDITTLIDQACNRILISYSLELKDGEMLAVPQFKLEKTMSGFEAMNPKMDVRKDARSAMTPKRALKEKIIKEAKDLTLADVLGILDEMMCKFVQWMHGATVAQTIYNCLYILDESLYKDNPVLLGWFKVILHLLYETQNLLKNCKCLREEDFNYSHIMEKPAINTLQELEELLAPAEKYIVSTNDTKELKEGVLARVRLMKGLLSVFSKLIKEFKAEEVQKIIEYTEGRLKVIISTINLASPETSKCVDESVLHSFPIFTQIKKAPVYDKTEAYKEVELFLKHCRKLVELSAMRELQDIWKALDDFMHDKPATFTRTIYGQSIFPKDEFLYFGKEPLLDLNVTAIIHYSKSAKNFKTSPVFKDFMEKLSIMTRESIYVHLRTSAKHRHDLEVYFKDLGLLFNFAVSSLFKM